MLPRVPPAQPPGPRRPARFPALPLKMMAVTPVGREEAETHQPSSVRAVLGPEAYDFRIGQADRRRGRYATEGKVHQAPLAGPHEEQQDRHEPQERLRSE